MEPAAGIDGHALVQQLRGWGHELGFSQIGIAGIDLACAEPGLAAWLQAGFHGSMEYMARHGLRRARPAELVPGTVSVITARLDYLPRDAPPDWAERETARCTEAGAAVISVYARGRDYHKLLRARLQQLASKLQQQLGTLGHRVFTDSAPVLEAELATRSGIGWRGKHTLVLHREAGSMFFLGEIYVDVALPASAPVPEACGTCQACITVCPTQAIVAPYRLDARRCISYLTIEHVGPIPEPLRAAIGQRIYGCDDCQLVCPWNKYARRATLADFDARDGLADASLLTLWLWSEQEFLRRTEGSAMRRVGWLRWRRNLAVAMGNAWREHGDLGVASALHAALSTADTLVQEHIAWALAQRSTVVGENTARGVVPVAPAQTSGTP